LIIDEALGHHSGERFNEAETCYRAALRIDPRHHAAPKNPARLVIRARWVEKAVMWSVDVVVNLVADAD